jgi:hypothetical protein
LHVRHAVIIGDIKLKNGREEEEKGRMKKL